MRFAHVVGGNLTYILSLQPHRHPIFVCKSYQIAPWFKVLVSREKKLLGIFQITQNHSVGSLYISLTIHVSGIHVRVGTLQICFKHTICFIFKGFKMRFHTIGVQLLFLAYPQQRLLGFGSETPNHVKKYIRLPEQHEPERV